MYSAEQLCERIVALYPDIGVCGINIDVTKDTGNNAWVVHLEKGSHSLDHFLDLPDARNCMEGEECIALGLDIAQLQKNIEGKQF